MSRIGKKPIILPGGVEATVAADKVGITGPKGNLVVALHPAVTVELGGEPKALTVSVADPENVKDKALWGLTRQLLANAVEGVQKPFEKSLEFVGVGFKVALTGRNLKIEVGFSHPVDFPLPEGIEAKVEKQILTFASIDKQLVGETAARVRRIKPPEPYKGKGIKYTDEVIKRKAGKAAVKSA
ncbi:MAG: 50S ribosomal protein L6 [Patescibacteria group bacterium]